MLYLIDGYAQFFRAYHAIRSPMSSPVTREPTNMTFGFVGMLLRLLRAQDHALTEHATPTHLAVALDVGGDRGTFRSRLYPPYKATRPEPPDDLEPQVRRCLSLLAAIGVPCPAAEGFEADDVIATIARRLEPTGCPIRVISKDKDLKQLLHQGRFELFDIHTQALITADDLAHDTGITPAQVVDMLTLMGDTADNVPGVDGIGPKTAAQLIAQFGSLDAVLAHAAADLPDAQRLIKGKRRESILAAAAHLPLSRTLVTLRHDAPVDFNLDDASVQRLDLHALAPILKELGFNRYQDELRALLGEPSAPSPHTPSPLTTPRPHQPAQGLFDSPPPDSLFASPPHTTPSHPRAPQDGDYRTASTQADLDELISELQAAQAFAIDTETTSPRPVKARLCGLSFSTTPGRAWYVPVLSPDPSAHLDTDRVLSALRPLLEDPARPKVGHNIKYDLIVLRNAGVNLRGLTAPGGGDTMIASYLADASRSSHAMDALALDLLHRHNIPIDALLGSGKNQITFDRVPLDLASAYAAEDADVTLRLASALHPKLRDMALDALYRDVELPLVEVLAELEFNGVRVDPDELDRQRRRLSAEIDRLRIEIDLAADAAIGRRFDPDSPKQLAAALFNTPDADSPGLGIKPIKKTKTGHSTDAEVLQKLADDPSVDSPIPALILELRQLTKLVGTYLVALREEINPITGRVHASFNQTVAATGRLSSSDPNLQNIPIRSDTGREIRRAFVADPGNALISADYSQIELRLLAHLSNDPALIEAFHRGEDIHTAVAAQIHGLPQHQVTRAQRNGAKMVNFGIVYGITPFGLARRLGLSNAEAASIIDGYKARFAGITTFLEECVSFAKRHGYVQTMLKRRRPIPDIDSNQPHRRALAERMAINTVVQGSAADLIKLAMIDIHRLIRDAAPPLHRARMLLQIHDELVFEAPRQDAPAAAHAIAARMEAAMTLSVPLRVDHAISDNWFDGK